eukprot:3018486-Alexandrium_andersonii.AAC.1
MARRRGSPPSGALCCCAGLLLPSRGWWRTSLAWIVGLGRAGSRCSYGEDPPPPRGPLSGSCEPAWGRTSSG